MLEINTFQLHDLRYPVEIHYLNGSGLTRVLMNLDPFTVKDSHRHIRSNTKLRLNPQGKVKDGRSNDDEKEGLVRATLARN